MKYFTPQLINELSTDDDSVLDKLEDKWEREQEKYVRYLREHRRSFPAQVRELLKWNLHDATINAISYSDEMVIIYLEAYRKPLTLVYQLTKPPQVIQHALRKEAAPMWLYDEMRVVRKGLFEHSILVRDGSEWRLTFNVFTMLSFHPMKTLLFSDIKVVPAEPSKNRERVSVGGYSQPLAGRVVFAPRPGAEQKVFLLETE